MKKFIALAVIVGFIINCHHKKKGLLLPFFFLGSQHTATGGVPGNSGSPGVVFVPGDGSGNPATPPETPSNSGNTGSTPSDSGSNSNSGNNSGSNSGSDTSSGSSGSSSGSGSSNSGSSDTSSNGSGSGGSSNSGSGSSSNSGSDSTANNGSGSSSGGSSSGDSGNSNSGSNDTSSNTSGSGSSSSGSGSSNSGSSSSGSDSTANSGSNGSSSGSNSSSGSGSGSSSGDSTASNGGNSGSNNSGNSNSGSNSGNNGSGSSGSGDSGGTPPIVAVVVVEDPKGTPTFNFNTTINIPLNLTVVDNQSKVVAGATVLVYDENSNILFQGVSDSSGKVTGTLTVPTSVGNITIDISIGGESISQYISLESVLGINRTIRYEINLPPVAHIADSDGDGIPDDTDIYPNDATRSTEISYPSEGVFTVAYEDLYPSAGDADLNDYVIQFKNEEDLNSAGKIVRLRGVYQHVARGAGYRHQLYIKLPVEVGASVTYKLTQADGSIVADTSTVSLSAWNLKSGYRIFDDSSKTIGSQNANPGEVFKPGYIATIEIVFNAPVERAKLGSFPYDLYAYVINTKQEVHFPGLYKTLLGTDKYLDVTGFPWAILVPGAWKYPYERNDIRNPLLTGYSEFNIWVATGGKEYKTWYFDVTNESKVFPVPTNSSLLGYLFLSVKKFAIFYALGLVIAGGIAVYFLRKKHSLTA